MPADRNLLIRALVACQNKLPIADCCVVPPLRPHQTAWGERLLKIAAEQRRFSLGIEPAPLGVAEKSLPETRDIKHPLQIQQVGKQKKELCSALVHRMARQMALRQGPLQSELSPGFGCLDG